MIHRFHLDDYYIVTDSDGSSYVWAASNDNKLEKRTVQLGDADEKLMQHQIVSGLTEDDYICQPQEILEEGLPVVYNSESGFEETESMYTWDDEWDMEDDEEYWDETEDWDETEEWLDEDMFFYEGEGDLTGFYNPDDEVYDEEVETDEEGYIIMD